MILTVYYGGAPVIITTPSSGLAAMLNLARALDPISVRVWTGTGALIALSTAPASMVFATKVAAKPPTKNTLFKHSHGLCCSLSAFMPLFHYLRTCVIVLLYICACVLWTCVDSIAVIISIQLCETISHSIPGQNGNGECSVCDSGYMGANCDLSIPLVVIPTVLAVFALVTAIVIFAVWYLRR